MSGDRIFGCWRRAWLWITILLFAPAVLFATDEEPEARISIDVKNADIRDVVGALVEVAGAQAVFDPGVVCRLTLSMRELVWIQALRSSLDACGLGYKEQGSVVRVAKRERLIAEAADLRRLAEQKAITRSRHVETFRLSYARAREMAHIVKRFLSEHGAVVSTNVQTR